MKLTYILILLMALAFAWEFFNPATAVQYVFSGSVAFSEPWVWVTSIFLHADIVHLLSNVLVLFFFGLAVEGEMGWKKMLLIFFLGAFAGHVGGLLFYAPAVQALGASAGIFALVGAGMLVRPLDWSVYPFFVPIPLVFLGILYTVWNVYGFFYGGEGNISFVGHLGGLAIGLLFGFRHKGVKKSLKTLTLASIGLVILLLVVVPVIARFLNIG